MGRKVPMWQCILAIVAMIVFLFWNVMGDEGGEAHIGLILAACVAGIIGAANGWKWSYMEQGILAAINRSMQAMLILAVDRFLDGWRRYSFHDVLRHQGYRS